MISCLSLIECGIGCNTKDNCNSLSFKDGNCELGKNTTIFYLKGFLDLHSIGLALS